MLVTMIMFAMLGVMFGAGLSRRRAATPRLTRATCSAAGDLGAVRWCCCFLCTVFNFLIMNAWQRWVSATEAGLIYCIEPVIAAILARFLPGWISRFAGIDYANETLTWSLLVGGALIVGATVLVATEKRTA